MEHTHEQVQEAAKRISADKQFSSAILGTVARLLARQNAEGILLGFELVEATIKALKGSGKLHRVFYPVLDMVMVLSRKAFENAKESTMKEDEEVLRKALSSGFDEFISNLAAGKSADPGAPTDPAAEPASAPQGDAPFAAPIGCCAGGNDIPGAAPSREDVAP